MSPSIHSPQPAHRLNAYRHGAHLTPSSSSHPLKRSRTPCDGDSDALRQSTPAHSGDRDGPGDRRRRMLMRDLYARAERMVSDFFSKQSEEQDVPQIQVPTNDATRVSPHIRESNAQPPPKKSSRAIDEDDYGDDEEDEDEELPASPLRNKDTASSRKNSGISSVPKPPILAKPGTQPPAEGFKSSEDARKHLEEENRVAELAVKERFQNVFYTLEHDHDAMLEQQKLDELDRQVETEISGEKGNGGNSSGAQPQQGTLSSTNLGASSLTLKHLIAKIDKKRGQVAASDTQLRTLMSEVRKNRSKWASEERVGQEELYEGAEQVLLTLKASEMSAPFLAKVNKRDAPDYHIIIKHPMDIGTMLKKLKSLQYQSKKQFVDDLELIWSNCLKYNADPNHLLRRKAEHMRKETARLTPLIPDIVIRDRAEVEAEERRLHPEFDDGEESEDEPLMSTRGRKAPGKTSKKGTSSTARKAPTANNERTSTPGVDARGSGFSNIKTDHFRSDFESVDGSQRGFVTPPPGTMTPAGGSVIAPDASEIDGMESSLNGAALAHVDDAHEEDEEYQTWKRVTKKDRARVAAERHRLFARDQINPEEPALLRTKAAMRRFLQKQGSKSEPESATGDATQPAQKGTDFAQATTLAEGMDTDEGDLLPDYYAPLSNIPSLNERLSWTEDADGQVIDRREETLRALPQNIFKPVQSLLTSRIDGNMRQMQETRKIVAKIGVVKQMQLQAQTYQNQFQKYEIAHLQDVDIEPVVVSDDGPIMSPMLCRAALQRSVGKIFYHAGFEDFQPAALETIIDITSNYFTDLVHNLCIYHDAPKVTIPVSQTSQQTTTSIRASNQPSFELKPRFTDEEAFLHILQNYGHDLEGLDSYIKEDMDRLRSRLEVHHARTKDYLAELLRPALDPTQVGTDGVGAFNDGSEQFVGGDFAEDLDEDFFGFRELGLDKEFSLANLSVPLHLLQSRVHNAYQPQSSNVNTDAGQIMPQPDPYPAITLENVESQIGLVRDFFRKKLDDNDDDPLVEDDDLPMKQRFPKPRLPPTGKISSPRKRPIREQQMMARKKKRLEIEAERERERQKEAEARGEVIEPKDASASSDAVNAAVNSVEENTSTADTAKSTTEQPNTIESNDPATVLTNGDGPNPKTSTSSSKTQDATAASSSKDTLTNGDTSDPTESSNPTNAPLTPTSMKRHKPDLPPPLTSTTKAKTGDPQKKRPMPPDDTASSSAQNGEDNRERDRDYGKDSSTAKRQKSISADEAEDAQGDADGDAGGDVNAKASRNEKKKSGDGPRKSNEDDSSSSGTGTAGGEDANGNEAEIDDPKKGQNGMLSPESVSIAAH